MDTTDKAFFIPPAVFGSFQSASQVISTSQNIQQPFTKGPHPPLNPQNKAANPAQSRSQSTPSTHHLGQSQTQGLQYHPGLQQGRESSHGPSLLLRVSPRFTKSSLLAPLSALLVLSGAGTVRKTGGAELSERQGRGVGGWREGGDVCTAPKNPLRRKEGASWEGEEVKKERGGGVILLLHLAPESRRINTSE